MPFFGNATQLGSSGSSLTRSYKLIGDPLAVVRRTPRVRIVGLTRVTVQITQVTGDPASFQLFTTQNCTSVGPGANGDNYQPWPIQTIAALGVPQIYEIRPFARLVYLELTLPAGSATGDFYLNLHCSAM